MKEVLISMKELDLIISVQIITVVLTLMLNLIMIFQIRI